MRYEKTVEARDTDDGRVYDAFCHDTALNEPCFRSVGWNLKKQATARLNEHMTEHATGEPARELEAFRRDITTEYYESHVQELLDKNALPTVEDSTEEDGEE